MGSHKDMKMNKFWIPTTKHFFKGGKRESFKGINFAVYGWWMERNGTQK